MNAQDLEKLLAEVTPGEWIAGDDPEGDYPHKISIHTPDNFYIAVLDNCRKEDANARLIAIAPSLARRVIAAEKVFSAFSSLFASTCAECDECADRRSALAAYEAAK